MQSESFTQHPNDLLVTKLYLH